jgi:hypothetical protein
MLSSVGDAKQAGGVAFYALFKDWLCNVEAVGCLGVDLPDVERAFVGFQPKAVALVGKRKAAGIEAFAERQVETVVEQLLCLLWLASESVYDPLLLGACILPDGDDFVEGLYAVDDKRFANGF